MNIHKFKNLNIGVKLVKNFPSMKYDPSILYGVDLDGEKEGGLELVEESEYDTTFHIFYYDGKYGVGYTVETPQTWEEPADYHYNEIGGFKTLEEAENKLIEMIQSLGVEDPDFD